MRKHADTEKIASWRHAILQAEDAASIGQISQEEYEARGLKAIEALGHTFDYVRRQSGIRDTWKEDEVMILSQWIDISSVSFTTRCRYEPGFGNGMFQLRTSLRHASNVQYMTDGFWIEFTRLSDFGDVLYENHGTLPKPSATPVNRELNKREKCATFCFIRDAILFQQASVLDDLSVSLSVSWPLPSISSETLSRAALALKCLHKIDYALYRVSYQQERKNLQRYAKENNMDWKVLRDNLRRD